MDLTLSSEQESIREAVRGVLGARLSARRGVGEGSRLTGAVQGIADGGAADVFLVLGRQRVRCVPADAGGVHVATRESLDPTRRLADVTFEDAPAELLPADAVPLRRAAMVLV